MDRKITPNKTVKLQFIDTEIVPKVSPALPKAVEVEHLSHCSYRQILVSWYILVPAMVGLGIAAGALAFVYLSPGKPHVGVIEVPYTVIDDRSANLLSQYID